MLLTLGIDSAFSLTEAIVAGVRDKFGWGQRATNITVAGIAFVFGILITTRAGLYWLDIVDYFMNNFGLFVVGLLQAIFIGWIFGAKKLRIYANGLSELTVGRWWDILIRYFVPLVSLVLLIYTLVEWWVPTLGRIPWRMAGDCRYGCCFDHTQCNERQGGVMPISAWIMFGVGSVILFGGIAYCIIMSFRR